MTASLYATKLGLDIDRFKNDLDSERLKQLIEADKAEGEKLGVRSTPTFFVHGKRYAGALSFDHLKQIVQREQRMQVSHSREVESVHLSGDTRRYNAGSPGESTSIRSFDECLPSHSGSTLNTAFLLSQTLPP